MEDSNRILTDLATANKSMKQKQKRSNLFWNLFAGFLVLVVIVALGCGGYWLYQKSTEQDRAAKQKQELEHREQKERQDIPVF